MTIWAAKDQTTGAGDVVVKDDAQVKASQSVGIVAKGNVKVLKNAKVVAEGGNVAATAQNAAIAVDGQVKASANATLTAETGITVSDDNGTPDALTGLVAADGGKATLTTATGDVVVEDGAQVTAQNDIDVVATTGNVTVKETAKVLAGASTTDGSVKIYAAKDQTTGAGDAVVQDTAEVTATKAVEIVAKDNINVLGGAKVTAEDGDVAATAQNAAIAVDGQVKASANATLTAEAGITVSDDNGTPDALTGLVAADGGKATLTTATGDVVVEDGAQVTAQNDIDVVATTGNVTVKETAKVLAGTSTTDGSVKIYAAKDQTTGAGDAVVQDTAEVKASKAIEIVAKDNVNVLDKAVVNAKGIGVTSGDTLKIDAQTGDITVDGNNAGYAQVVAGDFTLKPGALPTPAPTDTSKMNLSAGKAISVQNQAAVAAAGDMTATAKDGDLTVQNTAYALAGGNVTIDAEDAGAGAGSILVANDGNILTYGMLTATAAKDVTVKAATADSLVNAVAGATITAKNGSITLGDAGGTDQSQIRTHGNLKLDAQKGSITIQDKTLARAGTATSAGDVTIWAAKDQTTVAGDVVVKDDAQVKASQSVGIVAKDNVKVLKNAKVVAEGGNIVAEAQNAKMDIDGEIVAYADVSLTAKDDITVSDGTSDATPGLVKAQSGKVEISAGAAGTTASVTVKENAKVEAAKNVAVVAGKDITVRDNANVLAGNKGAAAEAIKLDAVNGAISVDGTVVATANDVKLNAGTSVTVKDDNGTADGQKGLVQAAAGAVDIAAVNAITVTDTADVTAGTTVDIKSTGLGAIRIDTTGSVTANDGNVTIQNDQGNVTIQNATVEAKKGPVVTATSGKANVAITATKGTVMIAKGTQSATVRAAADVTIAASDDSATTATVEGNVWVDESTVEATAGDVLVGTSAAKVSSVTVWNGATLEAGKSVKAYAADNVSLLDGTGATKVTANDGDVVIDAEDGVSVAGADITATDAGSGAGNVEITAAGANGGYAIAVAGDATITADKAVTAKATAATTAGDISITTIGTVLAKDGNVTIDNDSGNVTIQNATVTASIDTTATTPATTAIVDIDANGSVVVEKGTQNATITGATGVTIDTDAASNGNITIGNAASGDGTTITATTGALAANADGAITQQSDTKLDAKAANVDLDAKTGITVAGNAVVEAATTVDMNNTAAGDIAITSSGAAADTTKSAVTAKNGGVTIDADNGTVTIANGKVEAINAGTAGSVDIDATAGIAVNAGAQVVAADNMTADTTGGDIATAAGTKVSAGGTLAASATDTTPGNGNINMNGAVTVVGTSDFKAAGDIAATDIVNNDFGGAVTATGATGAGTSAGAVTLKDKNAIDIARVEATGAVDIDAAGTGLAAGATAVTVSGPITTTAVDAGAVKAIDIEAANGNVAINGTVTAATTPPGAGGSVAVSAGTAPGAVGDVTVAAAVTADQDVGIQAKDNVTINANVDAGNNANVTATVGNIASAAGATIGAGNTATATAGGNADVNVNSQNVNVIAGGNAAVDVVKGTHNPFGNLNINANAPAVGSSSVSAGGNLDLTVAGELKTTSPGKIQAGGNASIKAGSTVPPLSADVGGTISGSILGGAGGAMAFDMPGKYPEVLGNRSMTAIFINGRLAGGDPRLFSILQSYESEAVTGVKYGPLAVPNTANVFASPFYTMDMLLGAPASLGQTYPSDKAGKVDAGDEFTDQDTALDIQGLPASGTIDFSKLNVTSAK